MGVACTTFNIPIPVPPLRTSRLVLFFIESIPYGVFPLAVSNFPSHSGFLEFPSARKPLNLHDMHFPLDALASRLHPHFPDVIVTGGPWHDH